MPATVTSLLALDATKVEQFRLAATALLQEYNPTVDLKRGPTQDLVVTPRAALDAAAQETVDRVRRASSLATVAADPTLADPDTVDNLLSNYGLTRQAAAAATGNVTIVLSALVPVVVPTSVTFAIGGRTYAPDRVYAGRTSSGAVSGPGDRLITAVAGGYAFTITVVDRATGAAGNARAGAAAVPSAAPARFVRAYATADFTGGRDAQTNAELLALLTSGLAAKTWSSRDTVEGMLRQAFPDVAAVSIVGFGDAEMLRDQHQLWPGSCGGRADLFARTAARWTVVSLAKTATLISKVGAVGTWQVTIGRDDAPGYYEVDRVLLPAQDPTATGFAASLDTRGRDLTPDAAHAYFPDVASAFEAVYTRYQTASVRFVDTVTNATALTTGVATAPYVVLVRALPDVDDVQDWLGDRTRQPPGGDALVVAAVPCFTTVAFTLTVPTGTPVDTAAVTAAVAAAVNAGGFAGTLPASLVSATVHALFGTVAVALTAFALAGRVRRRDGTNVALSSSTILTVPNDPANGVTARTVAFFLEPADVTVTVVFA